MQLNVYTKVEELILCLADNICKIAEKAIQKRGEFNLVLSGGNSPKRLYEMLATQDYRNRVDWGKTYFFFGDERYVPEHDSQRNSLMAQKALFEPLQIPESHIFKINTTVSPEDAAIKYYDTIITHFSNKKPKFDLILLGLGDNAHTASLFPHTSVLDVETADIQSVYVSELDSYRITMTAPLINRARNIAFLVYGTEKSDAVRQVIRNEGSTQEYPARLIVQHTKRVQWYLDTQAVAQIQSIF